MTTCCGIVLSGTSCPSCDFRAKIKQVFDDFYAGITPMPCDCLLGKILPWHFKNCDSNRNYEFPKYKPIFKER